MKLKSPLHVGAIVGVVLVGVLSSVARQGTPPLSHGQRFRPLAAVKQLVLPPTDARAELANDARAKVKTPLRFAVATPVQITPANDGTWEEVPGGRLWRLRVVSPGATDLNFGFTTCRLPEGATLHIYSEDEDYFQGPYSARDNKGHGQLWTPMVPGSRAVIELFVPADAKEEVRLLLSRVNRGYRDMFRRQKNLSAPRAGSCNNDVVCALADPWRNEIRSVGVYTLEGSFTCTGTLMNNVSNNFKNYFLTANHCEINAGNASTIVVYWNFESPTCGLHGGGSLAQNQSGATFRAAKADVDFCLIELDDVPDSSFHVYYSGWDRSGATPSGAVGIHHPNTDEKSISFANSALTSVESCIDNNPVGLTHWQVIWDSGVTEPGSSGSGIWDPVTHRLVGTLSGGDSLCSTPKGPDCYGKFSVSWASGSAANSRLRDWLDPANTGATNLPGRDPNPFFIVPAGSSLLVESCAPANGVIDTGELVTVSFSLRSLGISNTTSLVATLLAGNGVTVPGAPQNYGTLVAGGAAVTGNFSFIATGACGGNIMPTLQLQDGTNDLGLAKFTFQLGLPSTVLTQQFDTVLTPALPAGWVNAFSGLTTGWRTVSTASHTPPNSAFAEDPGDISDATLTSPSITISNATSRVMFRHSYDTEFGSEPFDGGVLEISYNGGPFFDILAAGGSFVLGGYNGTISTDYGSPIAGRQAWSGNSGGFITTLANLPAAAAGQNVRLRWRMATDESFGEIGWHVDTIAVIDSYACCHALVPPQIVETVKTNSNFRFSFNTVPGQTYVTEYQPVLDTNFPWTAVQTNVGDGTKKSVTNSISAMTNRFFRVRTQ